MFDILNKIEEVSKYICCLVLIIWRLGLVSFFFPQTKWCILGPLESKRQTAFFTLVAVFWVFGNGWPSILIIPNGKLQDFHCVSVFPGNALSTFRVPNPGCIYIWETLRWWFDFGNGPGGFPYLESLMQVNFFGCWLFGVPIVNCSIEYIAHEYIFINGC